MCSDSTFTQFRNILLPSLLPVVVAEVDPVADGEVRHGSERAAVRGKRLRLVSRQSAIGLESITSKLGCNSVAGGRPKQLRWAARF